MCGCGKSRRIGSGSARPAAPAIRSSNSNTGNATRKIASTTNRKTV